MGADLRAAIRALSASRTFTVVSTLVLTLGIAAVAAVFAVVDAVLLRRLPFDTAECVVAVRERGLDWPADAYRPLTAQNYREWAAARDVFESLAVTYSRPTTTVDASGNVDELRQVWATASFFDVLRLRVAFGRAFDADAETDGRHRVALISHGLWHRRFGGAHDVLGRPITLNGEPFEIIGVLPPDLVYPPGGSAGADVFVPYVVPATERLRTGRASYYLLGVGRLAGQVTAAQAQARLHEITGELHRAYPGWNTEMFPQVLPYVDVVVGATWRSWLLLLLATAGVVLVIAAVNMTMLQLARSPARQREMAVRAAMGAGRWRLCRQVLLENVVVTLMASAAGLLLAHWGLAIALTSMPVAIPRAGEVGVDVRVALVVAVGATLVGAVAGLVPAWRLASTGIATTLTSASRVSTGREGRGWRGGLIVLEVALVLPLLVGTALLVRTFVAVSLIDPGVDLSNVIVATVTPPAVAGSSTRGPAPEEMSASEIDRYVEMGDRARGLAGVDHATVTIGGVPMGNATFLSDVRVDGQPWADDQQMVVRRTSPDYFATFRIAILHGRVFAAHDRGLTTAPAVINATAARTLFGAAPPPLGRTFEINSRPYVVVGIVADSRQNYEEPARPEAVLPVWAGVRGLRAVGAQLVLRVQEPGAFPTADLRRVAAGVMPGAVVTNVVTAISRVEEHLAWRRHDTMQLGILAVLGLVIATIGVYGALAYAVEHRTREIGIHIALGAGASLVLRRVAGETAWFVAVGLAVGSIGAWILTRVIELQLVGVERRDPASFVLAGAAMAAAALIASVVPARRATRVDPVEALRAE